MSIIRADLQFILPSTVASDFTTASSGGAARSPVVQIIGNPVGEVLFHMNANSSGGGNLTQYAKVFGYNANGTSSSFLSRFWIRNSLDVMSANAQLTLQPASASDGTSKQVKVIGFDAASLAVYEYVRLNGLTPVSTLNTYSVVSRLEVQNYNGGIEGSATTATGDISVAGAVSLGKIPAGYRTATGEIDIGVENALNDSNTIALPSTAPSGITFSRPRLSTSALSAIGGTLVAGAKQGIWIRWVLPETAIGSSDWQLVLVHTASAS